MQFSLDLLQSCWFLAGPTASGKSDAGLELAGRLNAEIVSLDSMALYRGLDIGTAKPSPAACARVPHHLIDVIDPHEEYAVADYLQAAETACRDILSRGRTPLFVGGTGLYLRSILRGVFDGPPADWEFRAELERQAAQDEPAALHRRLQQVDPAAAASLHPHDVRRVIRALEVHHLTGRPLSEQQRQPPLPEERRPRHVYWLSPPRGWLYERIDRRVEHMLAEGLVEEVRGLLASEKPLSRTARQALGYTEILDHFAGRTNLETAVQQIQTRTRQFAKRQHTWFRNLEECVEIEIDGHESPERISDRLFSMRVDSRQ